MNWKLVATLMVGVFLAVGCASQQTTPEAPGAMRDPTVDPSQPESAKPADSGTSSPGAPAPATPRAMTPSTPASDGGNDAIMHDRRPK